MIDNNPIGIFDSGVGGLSIWLQIIKKMPNENTLYLADNKNNPYGEKSENEILKLSIKNCNFLISKNVKVIVVACNTATTVVIEELRKRFNVPFIGIEPPIKMATRFTLNKKIGVLATKRTLSSSLYLKTKSTFIGDYKFYNQIGENLVEMIEDIKTTDKTYELQLNKLINPLVNQNQIDCLALGCTHYYFLKERISKLYANLKIIDASVPVTLQTEKVINEHQISNSSSNSQHQIFFNLDDRKNIIQELIKHQTDKKADINYLDF